MRKHFNSTFFRQAGRLTVVCLLAALLALPMNGVQAQRRGSFGGGSFGGSGRSFGGSFGGSRSSGSFGGGGGFGGSRSSGSFGGFGGARSSNSFGGSRSTGSFGNSGSFNGGGRMPAGSSFGGSTSRSTGSFGRSGSFGSSAGIPRSTSSYYYRGSSYPARYYGGWRDYSYAWGAPSWYYWTPFHPAFYWYPPMMGQGGYYEPGGFNFVHLFISVIFFVIVIALLGKLLFGRSRGVRYTSY